MEKTIRFKSIPFIQYSNVPLLFDKGCYLKRFSVLSFGLLAFFSGVLNAEVHANLSLTNDYVWRSFSKSSGQLALQANIDYEHSSGAYLGTSFSTVEFEGENSDDINVEITPYAGWTFALSDDWRFDAQWSRYLYDGKSAGNEIDYNEFYGLLNYQDTFTAKIAFSDDYYQLNHTVTDFELSYRYPISDHWEWSSGMGYTLARSALNYDYIYWNSGLSLYFENCIFDFRYVDSRYINEKKHADSYGDVYESGYFLEDMDASFVFSLTFGF